MVDTTEDQLSNRIRQISVFLPNRLGSLLMLNRILEKENIKILGLSVADAADHAVVRMVLDQPTLAAQILQHAGHVPVETELLGVVLPPGSGIRKVLTSVIAAELNIDYIYSLMRSFDGRPILALHLEDPDSGARALLDRGMHLLNQDDLN